jgi:TonB-dependent receptor
MMKTIFRLFLPLLLAAAAYAAPTGEFSLFVLKEGKALGGSEVLIDKTNAYVTDSDGYLFTKLEAGKHQIEVVTRENGRPLAFVKKTILILEGKQSQMIISLKADDTLGFSDVEAPEGIETEETNATAKTAAKGSISVELLSAEEGKAIKNARIYVKGLPIEAKSDDKGRFSIELPAGEQTLSIIHSDYSAQTVKVTVAANEVTNKVVEMTPSSMELEEFVVLAPHVEGSVAAVVAEEKNSESIANIIGSAQMSKQGDSDAASALKRVPGITVLGGKYIYVRGLGDRYSSTELNGMPLPSPNPIKRTVPLDMFPSGVIGSLQVQKTFTPDITGAFGGGYVNVRTKQKVDEDYAKIKIGTKIHDSFGKEVTSYEGSDTDWTGYDHSYRPFSDAFVDAALPTPGTPPPSLDYTDAQMQGILQKRNIDKQTVTVPAGVEAQLEFAKAFVLADEHKLNVFATYGYKTESYLNTYTSHDYIISRYGVQESEPDNTAVNNLFRTTYQHGGTFNAGYEYKNFDIKYTKLYVLNTLDQTRDVEGTFGENNSREKQVYFEWQERELNIDQLVGGVSYDFLVENRFDFGGELATASEYVPNDVYYNYKQYFSTQPYVFAKPDSQLTYNSRSTDDKLYSFYLKNRSDIPLLSDEDYLEVGAVKEEKDREGRRVELTVDSNIDDADVISGPISGIIDYGDGSDLNYALTSQPKDQYDAKLERSAYYLKGLIKPVDSVDVTFGARYVDMAQSVDQYGIENNIVVVEKNRLAFDKLLPSVGIKYAPNETHQFRLAYSETFIYPDFREFVNAEFIHPVFLAKVSGNPDLVETDIQSYDARYDYYFSETDSLSAALFYKHMDNPIEDTQEFTTSTLPRYSFDNSLSADLAGVELSWYKHLGFISSYLEDFIFSGNYTYIHSEVELTDEQKEKFVTQERGLQGLSPHSINLSLTYDDPDNRSVNLSYNKMSERLMRVALKNGDVILGLDDYETPPHLLDFTWIEKFDIESIGTGLTLTFKVKNLLDDDTVWKQGDNTTLTYKTGRFYSLHLGAKF